MKTQKEIARLRKAWVAAVDAKDATRATAEAAVRVAWEAYQDALEGEK